MSRRKLAALLAVTTIAAGAMIACGGDDTRTITVEAQGRSFTPASITLQQGEPVKLRLENVDSEEHDLQVDGLDATILDASGAQGHGVDGSVSVHTQPGETAETKFVPNLTGVYRFFCTIPGHREAGMEGAITVQ